jgi:CheY-like chemotaxis protein
MTALLVLSMFVGFAVLDVLVRVIGRRLDEARARREREAVLATSLSLAYTSEAVSLKRVEVDAPRARILAVDDEAVILDSFRKILVLAGFNVDTVENGPEALGLVQRRDYDFVFTDLKMPGMEGVEVVKAVHHLRPDVDIAVITGYATVETAVETMQHGAVDYVQKPFSEEELVDFANRLLIRRQARLAAQRQPQVRIAAPVVAETAASHEYCVPGGAFLATGHTWARIEASGLVRAGLDDFARKALGSVDRVELPKKGDTIAAGRTLFTLHQGSHQAHFVAPMSGQVTQVNEALARDPACVARSPYERGWVCLMKPSDLAGDVKGLRIGQPVVAWYQEEIDRLRARPVDGDWEAFEQQFLHGRP